MRIWNKIFIIGIFVAILFAGIGSYSYIRYFHENEEAYSVVQSSSYSTIASVATIESSVEIREAIKEQTVVPTSMIDFDKLEATNPDIIAWINIPGTKIDYPVAQHPTNDEYYLKHGTNGMASSHGCPYIELSDSGDFMEFNTVVYGHNMKDGSMFAGIHDFEKKSFFNEHREIKVYTKEHTFTYKTFGAVMYSDARIPYFYNDEFESDRTAFLKSLTTDSVPERSILANDVNVTEDDYIITLSTCDAVLRDNRLLLLAVLTEIDGQSAK